MRKADEEGRLYSNLRMVGVSPQDLLGSASLYAVVTRGHNLLTRREPLFHQRVGILDAGDFEFGPTRANESTTRATNSSTSLPLLALNLKQRRHQREALQAQFAHA